MNLIPGQYKEYWTGSRATTEPLTQNLVSLSLNDFDAQSKKINSNDTLFAEQGHSSICNETYYLLCSDYGLHVHDVYHVQVIVQSSQPIRAFRYRSPKIFVHHYFYTRHCIEPIQWERADSTYPQGSTSFSRQQFLP